MAATAAPTVSRGCRSREARRYQRTGSLLVVSIEHALYGITIFAIGLGRYFYHGA